MHRLRIGGVRPASIDPQIAAVHPAQFLQLLDERSALRPSFRIALRPAHQYADAPHPLRLLRARRERPCDSRAAEQCDELASFHSIISSASNCIEFGTSMLSTLAVCRLMTNSSFVDCTTGRSPGFSPLRIRPT